MRDRNDKIEGPFLIEENLLFRGMITVGATVRSGVMLDLRGTITGDLDVERGARAIINGTVNGTVRNHGGCVELFGTVDAVVDLSPEAQTVVKPGALIKGRNP
jgi:cytoskeletal protein CcmA (bactofilin family)